MEDTNFQTGIFEEMPFEEYQQAQGLNQSTLKQIFRPGKLLQPAWSPDRQRRPLSSAGTGEI